MSTDYSQLDRAELEARCAAAEKLCVVFGWSPTRSGALATENEDAAMELWMEWGRLVPDGFDGPERQPELKRAVPLLAAARRATRQVVLDRIREMR